MISHRRAAGLLALIASLSIPHVHAESSAELEARIEALNQELEALQRQLDQQRRAEGVTSPAESVIHTRDRPVVQREEAKKPEPLEESLAERRELERESVDNPFTIATHRLNYVLPVSHTTSPNASQFDLIDSEAGVDDMEMKFQFSAKVNLWEGLFGDTGDLYFAYTQRSWWQAYNTDASSPFRETNYEPELFVDFANDHSFLGWTNSLNRVSFNHQSNGRSHRLSRSWNRLILESVFVRDDWALTLAPYWRLPESDGDDENPDIERYMGYGDITLARRFAHDQEASLMVRGNPSAGNMGAQLDYSWPLFGNLRGYFQFYHGYGESMIDYDHRQNRFSLGVSFNPLLH
ncbi:phospholipase [Halomonas sp. MCCC 1A11036]|uniref:Phospholipase A1 n=1 Tax=Billgrantia zhangzhouensis TaxID=2733481 RepID=A0ABS9AEH4_9GAMM|nr:phospholipase A [Halomonas zhangzhouensis]MCE8020148.1 phospholipase [Halomonas zhangzhouensis]